MVTKQKQMVNKESSVYIDTKNTDVCINMAMLCSNPQNIFSTYVRHLPRHSPISEQALSNLFALFNVVNETIWLKSYLNYYIMYVWKNKKKLMLAQTQHKSECTIKLVNHWTLGANTKSKHQNSTELTIQYWMFNYYHVTDVLLT